MHYCDDCTLPHSCATDHFPGLVYAAVQELISQEGAVHKGCLHNSSLGVLAADHHAAVQWTIPKEGVVHWGRWGGRLRHPVCSLGCSHIPIGTSQAHHLWSSCSEYAFTPHSPAFSRIEQHLICNI